MQYEFVTAPATPAGLPTAVALSTALLAHLRSRSWAALQQSLREGSEDLTDRLARVLLTHDQQALLARYGTYLDLISWADMPKATSQPTVGIAVCTECHFEALEATSGQMVVHGWALVRRAATSRCYLTSECPGRLIRPKSASKQAVTD